MTTVSHGRFDHTKAFVVGIWKFSGRVDNADLLILADKWKSEEPELYTALHIRGCGRDGARGIGFSRRLAEGESMRDYVHKVSDQLKRQFGNDLIGWDIDDDVWIMKAA